MGEKNFHPAHLYRSTYIRNPVLSYDSVGFKDLHFGNTSYRRNNIEYGYIIRCANRYLYNSHIDL